MNGTTRSTHVPQPSARVLAAALAFLLMAPSLAGAQRPQFTARVELVQFQVRVTDASGVPVSGLEASDFQLKVNGSERPIATVYEVNVAADAAAGAPAADTPPAGWRQWILFFDAAFNDPRGVRAAQEAAREFVQSQVQPRDLVGVATFNTVVGARMILPPTRDREQVLAAVGGLGLNTATRNVDPAGFLARTMLEGFDPNETAGEAGIDVSEVIEEQIRQVSRLEFDQYAGVVSQYATQLGGIGDMLRTIRGRKHVVYFSKGFSDEVLTGQSLDALAQTTEDIQQNAGLAIAQSSAEQRFGSTDVRAELDVALANFQSADAVIHVVDPSGVGGGRDQTSISEMSARTGDFNARGGSRSALTALAGATGGEMYWDTNDLSSALAEIEETNRSYYVIAFPREDADGLLDLSVSVSREGAKVDAPAKLAAPDDFTEMSNVQKQLQLAEFVSKGIEASDLVFEVASGGFYGDGERARLPVVVEVPWEQLQELASSGKDKSVGLEIYSYALDENDRMVDLASGEVSLDFEAMSKSPAAGLPFRYYDLLWARPGERRVRVILRDKEIGRISSATSAPVTVPHHSTGEVAISGPIGIDWEHRGLIMLGFKAASPPPHKAGGPVAYPFVVGGEEYTPSAVLAGPPGSVHYAYFVAHNLGRADGGPQAMVALALQSPDGQMINVPGQEMVLRFYDEATDGTQMVVKAPLPPDLPTGYYQLLVLVSDQLKGARVTGSLPVWVSE